MFKTYGLQYSINKIDNKEIKDTDLMNKEIKKESKESNFSFKGPDFKIVDLERAIDSTKKTHKKIETRKGVYIEEEEDVNW